MFQIERDKRPKEVLRQNTLGEMEYLTFPALEETGLVEHFFSTRTGGKRRNLFLHEFKLFERGRTGEGV